MSTPHPVYVVEDDPDMRALLMLICEENDIRHRAFEGGEPFLAALGALEPGCVVLDMHLPGRSGLEVQAEMAARGRAWPVIVITGHGDVDLAVQSIRLGAIDFIEKPFDTELLLNSIRAGFRRLGGAEGLD